MNYYLVKINFYNESGIQVGSILKDFRQKDRDELFDAVCHFCFQCYNAIDSNYEILEEKNI